MNQKMKVIPVLTLILIASLVSLQAQILEPVTWSFSHTKSGDNMYDLKFTAQIDEGWSIYGLDIPEGGPISTGFEFNEPKGFTFEGEMKAPKAVVKYDPNFDMELSMYSERQVTFVRTVKVTSDKPVTVSGELVFMSCDATSCLPPDYVPFTFSLPGKETVSATSVDDNDLPEESITARWRTRN
jgi:hypothetical protein